MGYIKAEEILPLEVIELIQKYVDGDRIFIFHERQITEPHGVLAQQYEVSFA